MDCQWPNRRDVTASHLDAVRMKSEDGKALDVEEVRRSQMLITMPRAGIDARRADDRGDARRAEAAVRRVDEHDVSGDLVEAAADLAVRKRDLELDLRMSGIDAKLALAAG